MLHGCLGMCSRLHSEAHQMDSSLLYVRHQICPGQTAWCLCACNFHAHLEMPECAAWRHQNIDLLVYTVCGHKARC